MEEFKGWYTVFKGWYRKSFSHKNRVWHRIVDIDYGPLCKQNTRTVCGINIESTKYDFHMEPEGDWCRHCEKKEETFIETGRKFVPIGSTSILTKTTAITELKRLLKPRFYYMRILGNQGILITAEWQSDTSVSIYTQDENITKKRTKNVMTLHEIQADLGRFKSAIYCLCEATDALALSEKKKKKLKGKLTKSESQEYFDNIMYDIVKQKNSL